ncbi:tail fiber protein [Fulvivirga lutea]|uniref:Tail fiber protein n=1 Tax=Fulvivirga lutea TaxID=2810512 RepID=A0A974WIQ7_9BACT|nr:tail fiber protein [Fulvivirga lutea]QSE97877.1 tail fiber protein [Fulvivirga lutea]
MGKPYIKTNLRIIAFVASLLFSGILQAQNTVSIGTDQLKSNAVLWLFSSGGNQGLLLPSVANVTDISNPDAGMVVYQTSSNTVSYFNGTAWVNVGAGGGGGADQTLTYDAGTGQLTISGTGGNSQTLSAGGDVTGDLGNVQIATGAIQLADLSSMGAGADQILVYNGTAWEIRNLPSGTFSGVVTDGTLSGTGVTGDPLSVVNVDDADADPTNEIQNLSFDAGTNTLSLTEPGQPNQTVDLSSLAGGSALTAGTGIDITGGVISNTGDTDASDDFSGNFSDLAGIPANLDTDATDDVTTLGGLTDVNTTGATNGQVLEFNAGTWQPATVSGSGNMNTSTYDTGSDGVVDDAENLGGQPPSAYLDNTDNQDIANVIGQGNNTGGTTITGLPSPSANSDAATKGYVDTEIAAIPLSGDMLQATYDANSNDVVDEAESAQALSGTITMSQVSDAGSLATQNATISTDGTLAGNSNTNIPTEQAVKTYVDTEIGAIPAGGDLVSTNNLSDVADVATARTNLGLGTMATQNGTISTDGTLAGNSDSNIPTEQAVKTYVDTEIGLIPAGGDMLKVDYDADDNLEVDVAESLSGSITSSQISDAGALATLDVVSTTEITDGTITDDDVNDITAAKISVAVIPNLSATSAQGAFAEIQGDIDALPGIDETSQSGILIGNGTTITGVAPTSEVIFKGDGSTLVPSLLTDDGTNVGLNNPTPTVSLDISTTDGIRIPVGTTAERPASPGAGMIRYNVETGSFEGYDGSDWNDFSAGEAGGEAVGTILSYGGASVPAGYLACDGSAVSRTTFADLFAAIGTSWGNGDGSTTFNLPDLRGRFVRGVNAGTGNDPNAGSRTALNGGNTGDNVGSYQTDATSLPNSAFTTNTTGAHSHSIQVFTGGGGTGINFDNDAGGLTSSTGTAGDHSHTIAGGGDAETRPTNAYVQFIIKSEPGGTTGGGGGGSGTVTNVSGSGPISVANGSTTPIISISQASGSNNGFLSSADFNTFNNKLDGTVGTAPNNIVQLDGTGRLPAVDGSQLTNLSLVDTDDQQVDQFNLTGSTLNISLTDDGVPPVMVDLSSLNTDNQTATDVSVSAITNLTATNVQDALAEHQADIDGLPNYPLISDDGNDVSIAGGLKITPTDELSPFVVERVDGNPILTVKDILATGVSPSYLELTGAAIEIGDIGGTPDDPTAKLWNDGGTLYWEGVDLTGSAGATDLSGLSDANIDTGIADAQILIYDGTTDNQFENVSISGDIVINNTGLTSIQNDAVQLDDIQDNGTGNRALLANTNGGNVIWLEPANDSQVLGTNGAGDLTFIDQSAFATELQEAYDNGTTADIVMTGGKDLTFASSTAGELFSLDEANEFVGIGTHAPNAKLDIRSAGPNSVQLTSGAAGSSTSLGIGRTITDLELATAAIAGEYSASSGAGDVVVRQTSVGSERLILQTGTEGDIIIRNNNVGIKQFNPALSLDINGTDAVKLPVGTDAQRPSAAPALQAGLLRFNSTSNVFEGYDGSSWANLGAGGTSSLQGAYDGGRTIDLTDGSSPIVIQATSGSSDFENLLTLGVTDATERLFISNSTNGDANFAPQFRATTSGTNPWRFRMEAVNNPSVFYSFDVSENGGSSIGDFDVIATMENNGATRFNFSGAGSLSISPSLPSALYLRPYAAGVGQTSEIQFAELQANGNNFVGLKAPDDLTTDVVFTLPDADGTNGQVLTTDGSGNLSWTSGGSGVSDLQGAYDGGSNITLAANNGISIETSTAFPILTIDETNSRVGIGTGSPDRLFHLESNNPSMILKSTQSTSSASPTIEFAKDDGSGGITDLGSIGSPGSGDYLQIFSPTFFEINTNFATRLRVASTGNVGIGTTNTSNRLTVSPAGANDGIRILTDGANNQGRLILADDDEAQNVSIQAPDAVTANYTLTLPQDAGINGQVLSTDGSGILSWTNGGGGVSTLEEAYLGSGNVQMTAAAGDIDIRTETTSQQAFFIEEATGKVGIGTSTIAPLDKLNVSGGDVNIDLGQYYKIGNETVMGFTGSEVQAGSSLVVPLTLWAGGEYARLTNTGHFGIGTTNPLGPLQIYNGTIVDEVTVSGDIFSVFSSNLYIDASNNLLFKTANKPGSIVQHSPDGIQFFVNNSTSHAAGDDANANLQDVLRLDIDGEARFPQGIIEIDPLGVAPPFTTERLYNVGGDLFWDGTNISAGGSSPWTISGSDIYYTTGNVGIGTNAPNANSDLHVSNGSVLFDGGTGVTPVSGSGTRFMWVPAKRALRAGVAVSTEWDDANIGLNSVAFGSGNTASGLSSTASGQNNTSSGDQSTTFGQANTASGVRSLAGGVSSIASGNGSTALGEGVLAGTRGGFAVGHYNVGGGSASSFVSTDPLFEVGDGTGSANRSNALTVTHGGKTIVGGASQASAFGTLEVQDDFASNLNPLLIVARTGASSNSSMRFQNASTNINIGLTDNDDFAISALGSNISLTDLMTIDGATGNTGIGTVTANNKLDVAGDMVIGSGYAGSVFAPANGLMVEGNMTVGTSGTSLDYNFYSYTTAAERFALISQSNYTGANQHYGLFSYMQGAGSGTAYGLYLSNGSTTTGTEFGVYSVGEDRNYFSGDIGVGIETPSSQGKIHISEGSLAMDASSSHGLKWVTGNALEAHIFRWSLNNRLMVTNNGSGNTTGVYLADGATSWTSTSDKRLKENITDTSYGLSDLLKLSVKEYNFKTTKEKNKQIGFLAQDVYKVIPEFVQKGDDSEYFENFDGDITKQENFDAWGVDYSGFGVLAVKAIQEQQEIIVSQKAEIEALKAQIAKLLGSEASTQAQLSELKAQMDKLTAILTAEANKGNE